MTRQVFHRITITFVLAAISTGCPGPSPDQVESAKTRQPEGAKVRPNDGAKIRQIFEGIAAPHYYDAKWDLSPDAGTLALPYRGDSSISTTFPRPPVRHGVELWDLTSAKSTMLPESPDSLLGSFSAAFSKSGRALAVAHGRGITIFALPGRQQSAHIVEQGGAVNLTFTESDRTLLAVGTVPTGVNDGLPPYRPVVIRWAIGSGKRLSVVDFRANQSIESISPDGRYAVVNDFLDQQRRVYELATGTRKLDLPSRGAFTFSDDGSNVFHLGEKELSMIEVPSGKVAKRFDIVPPTTLNQAGVLAISSRAKLLAVGRYPNFNLASIISLETGKVLGTVECGPNLQECRQLCLSADGRTLVTQTSASDLRDQSVEPWLKICASPRNGDRRRYR